MICGHPVTDVQPDHPQNSPSLTFLPELNYQPHLIVTNSFLTARKVAKCRALNYNMLVHARLCACVYMSGTRSEEVVGIPIGQRLTPSSLPACLLLFPQDK